MISHRPAVAKAMAGQAHTDLHRLPHRSLGEGGCFRDSNNSEVSESPARQCQALAGGPVRDIITLFLNLMIANKLSWGQRLPHSTNRPLPIFAQGLFAVNVAGGFR